MRTHPLPLLRSRPANDICVGQFLRQDLGVLLSTARLAQGDEVGGLRWRPYELLSPDSFHIWFVGPSAERNALDTGLCVLNLRLRFWKPKLNPLHPPHHHEGTEAVKKSSEPGSAAFLVSKWVLHGGRLTKSPFHGTKSCRNNARN